MGMYAEIVLKVSDIHLTLERKLCPLKLKKILIIFLSKLHTPSFMCISRELFCVLVPNRMFVENLGFQILVEYLKNIPSNRILWKPHINLILKIIDGEGAISAQVGA